MLESAAKLLILGGVPESAWGMLAAFLSNLLQARFWGAVPILRCPDKKGGEGSCQRDSADAGSPEQRRGEIP